MDLRRIAAACLAIAIALGAAAGVPARAGPSPYRAPRTAYGAPDLNGVWSNNALTRLQRPAGLVPLVVPPAAEKEAERKLMASYAPEETAANVGGAQSEWWDGAHLARVDGELRTSWLVDPDDGQLPYTAEGMRRAAAFRTAQIESFD
ncbi:MAG TPA: hypothetical protein VGC92_14920, partial [Phenylobacterium sp.]